MKITHYKCKLCGRTTTTSNRAFFITGYCAKCRSLIFSQTELERIVIKGD